MKGEVSPSLQPCGLPLPPLRGSAPQRPAGGPKGPPDPPDFPLFSRKRGIRSWERGRFPWTLRWKPGSAR